jgi:enamine deaminase RidA (YjgF/YER057c/UK114 family)
MIEDKIKKLGITLPSAADPVGSYVATKIIGKFLYISGQISINEKGELIKGKLGKDLKTEDGYEAAKRCALSIVSQAKKACQNDLNKIKSCIKLTGFVNSTEDFIEQPKVINGASDLIIIHTEWNDFKSINFNKEVHNKKFIIFDMRNIYSPTKMKELKINYFGVGR